MALGITDELARRIGPEGRVERWVVKAAISTTWMAREKLSKFTLFRRLGSMKGSSKTHGSETEELS